MGLFCLVSFIRDINFINWRHLFCLQYFSIAFPFEKSVTLALKPVIVLPLGQAARNELAGCHGYLPRDASALVYLWPVCALKPFGAGAGDPEQM